MPKKSDYRKLNKLLSAEIDYKVLGRHMKSARMDVMIRWFCILFGNQFTPDDVLDHYPVDRLMHDIALALMAVQTQTTSILDEFPTKAAKTEAQAATA